MYVQIFNTMKKWAVIDVFSDSHLADSAEKQGEMQAVFYFQFAEDCTQMCLNGSLGYVEFARNHFVISPEVNHLCNLKFSGC